MFLSKNKSIATLFCPKVTIVTCYVMQSTISHYQTTSLVYQDSHLGDNIESVGMKTTALSILKVKMTKPYIKWFAIVSMFCDSNVENTFGELSFFLAPKRRD